MMTSVSILARSSGAARPLILVKGSILQLPHVGDRAGDSGRNRHGGARQVSPGARSLPSDKIAVGCRDGARPRRHALSVRSNAHAAAGLPPRKTGTLEYGVESFGFGVPPHTLGARNDPGVHAWCNMTAASDPRGLTQIREPRIGAGADEHPIDLRS